MSISLIPTNGAISPPNPYTARFRARSGPAAIGLYATPLSARGTIIGMMAGAADAAKLGEAINTFVSGAAKTLNISIEAKTDPGLGMMDFMEAESDPTSLLGKVNISAQAK